MSDVTGTLHETLNGKTYSLRLTLRGIAKLQDLHGVNVAGILDGTVSDPPPFGPVLDIVALALMKGEGISKDQADDLADDLVTADMKVFERVLKAAFPKATVEMDAPGNATGPTQAA